MVCKTENLHANCMRFIAKIFGRFLRDVFILLTACDCKKGCRGRSEGVNLCYMSCSVIMALCSILPVSGVEQELVELVISIELSIEHEDFTSLKLT